MKFFSTPKQKGTTLVISLLVSFLVLGLAMTVLQGVERTLEQAQNLQRGDQVFYGAESGMEAAFFHHNVRGAGTDFGSLDRDPFPASLEIAHPASHVDVRWTIDGRAQPSDGPEVSISGVLHRDEYIQIPLYWDGAENPGENPSVTGFDVTNNVFTLSVSRPENFNSNLEKLSNANKYDPLIGWGLVREHPTEGVQTLVSRVDPKDGPCSKKSTNDFSTLSSFICEQGIPRFGQWFGTANVPRTISLSSNTGSIGQWGLEGQILPTPPSPMRSEMSWKDFLTFNPTEAVANTYVLTLQALGTFRRPDVDMNGNGYAISGIPFTVAVTSGVDELPKQEFEVIARVQQGDFEKTIRSVIRERSASGAFNYVIFD